MKKKILIGSGIVAIALCSHAWASEALSYSGRLVNTNGSPVTGPVNVRVELAYTNAPTVILCTDTLNNISLSNGVFHLKVDFDCSSNGSLSDVLSQIPSGESAAIRIVDLTHSKTYSYQAVYSMPFAHIAETARQLVQMGASNNQVLKWNDSTKKWEPGSVTASTGGTVTDVTVTAPLQVTNGTSTPAISLSKADTSTNGYLSSTDWNTFNSKQGSITAGTTSQYYRGDKIWQTLDTSVVPENTNLYFTNARVLGLALTGFSPVSSAVVSTDTILQAFGKVQGQINSLSSDNSNFLIKNGIDSVTGVVNVGTIGLLQLAYTPVGLNDATNKAYVDSVSALNVEKSGDTMTGDLTLDTTLRLKGNTNYVSLKAHATTANYNFVFPANGGTSGYVLSTDGNGNTSWVNQTMVTPGAGTVTSSSIADGTIVDADISSSAAISQSKISNLGTDLAAKLSTTLANKKIFIGDASNIAVAHDVSGDATIDNTGILTLKNTGTAGTYTSVTTDAAGRVISGTNPSVVSTFSVTAPLVNSGTADDPVVSIPSASSTVSGYLSSGDWGIFNGKQAAISTSTNLVTGSVATNMAGGVVLNPHGTSAGNTGEIRFKELSANGSNYVSLKSPDTLAADVVFILPAVTGSSGDILTTNGTNPATLSWMSLSTNVLSTALTGLSTASNAVITASDSILSAMGKLQKQISDQGTLSVGGDLSGSLPNPSLAKIQGTSVAISSLANKNVLKYNGTNWVNAAVSASDLSSTGTADSTTYLAGDNTWKSFNSAVIAAPLTGLSSSGLNKGNSTIAATDTVLAAMNKLLFTQGDYVSKTADQTINGNLKINSLTGFITVPDPISGKDAANKDYVDSYGHWTKNGSNIYYSAGNVGINVASPVEKLEVDGNLRMKGTGKILFPYDSSLSEYYGLNVNLVDHAGGQSFRVLADNDSVSSPAIAVRSNHTVGFNTDAPGSTVGVNGNVSIGTFAGLSAPTNGLSVSGNVGIGTNSPGHHLHVVGDATGTAAIDNYSSSSDPYLFIRRARGTIASPAAVVTGDVLSSLYFSGHDGSNFVTGAKIEARANGTVATNSVPTDLAFYTGTSGAGSERVRILSGGNVGIGVTNPEEKLQVFGAIKATNLGTSNTPSLQLDLTGTGWGSSNKAFNIRNTDGTETVFFTLGGNGTIAGTLTQSSDLRLKRDIQVVPESLEKLMTLNGVYYKWKDPERGQEKQMGLIAQQVEKVFPEAVRTDEHGFKSVAYQNLIAPVINALKEINRNYLGDKEEISVLKKENVQLKTKVDSLEQRLAEIEKKLAKKDQ